MQLEFHPFANIFPLMQGAAFDALLEDIRRNGVLEPITLFEGKIVDGRNRFCAAYETGREVRTQEFSGTEREAIDFVWSKNATRRQMTRSQAAIAEVRRNDLVDTIAPIRLAAKERMLAGVRAADHHPVQLIAQGGTTPSRKTRDLRAHAAGTNHRYIEYAEMLVHERPDLADQVASGEKTITQAMRELRREKLAARVPEPLTGKYRVIYADSPWKYSDTLSISRTGLGEGYGPAEAHYPAMTVAELCALPVSDIAEDNAVLFLWVTSPLLEDAFQVIRAWGFKYKTSFVWDKVAHNWGHYNSARHELLLICTRGSCTPDVPKLFDSVQSIERGEHSAKPEEFRKIIDTLYPNGLRIELFRRGDAPEGWTTWGNEARVAA